MLSSLLLALSVIKSNYNPFPYQCESIVAFEKSNGRKGFLTPQHRPNTERERTKEIIRLVSSEMGADPRLFLIWAQRESKYNHEQVCVHESDIKANYNMWKKYLWTPHKDKTLNNVNKNSPEYWGSKERLKKINTYKNNKYYNSKITHSLYKWNGKIEKDETLAWTFAYGPYSMNSAGYMDFWDTTQPPWMMCSEDGVISTIVAVWAARSFQRQCQGQRLGGSYARVDRRFSRGHCDRTSTVDFYNRAVQFNLNPYEKAELGDLFPKEITDNSVILLHMRLRLLQECLTKDLFKTQLCTNEDAIGFAG